MTKSEMVVIDPTNVSLVRHEAEKELFGVAPYRNARADQTREQMRALLRMLPSNGCAVFETGRLTPLQAGCLYRALNSRK